MFERKFLSRAYARMFADPHTCRAAYRGLHFIFDKVGRKIASVVLSGICSGHSICGQKRVPVFRNCRLFQSFKTKTGRYRTLCFERRIIGIHNRYNKTCVACSVLIFGSNTHFRMSSRVLIKRAAAGM